MRIQNVNLKVVFTLSEANPGWNDAVISVRQRATIMRDRGTGILSCGKDGRGEMAMPVGKAPLGMDGRDGTSNAPY
jgi:hypothetical protein